MKALISVWLFLFSVIIVQAANTKMWPFDDPAQYVVSNSNKIEVAEGVARLKLQATRLPQVSMADYMMNSAEATDVALGPDASLGVSLTGLNPIVGTYTSRIFRGKDGNEWQQKNDLVSNSHAGKALRETSTNTPNLRALYRFNFSGIDAVSGLSGSMVGSFGASYTNECIMGSGGLNAILYGAFQTVNSTLLDNQSACTLSCWIKLRQYTPGAGLVRSWFFGLSQGSVGGRLKIDGLGISLESGNVLPLNQWVLITATMAAGQKNRIYINGILVAESSGASSSSATISQSGFAFQIGKDPYSSSDYTVGIFDDVMILSRALSASEIWTLYQQASSIGYQFRSGDSALLTDDFVGPDGATNSYYYGGLQSFVSTGSFNPSRRYLQYRIRMSASKTDSPSVGAVALLGSLGAVWDDVLGDFSQGITNAVTITPQKSAFGFVGLAKNTDGGYLTNGAYVSRVFDSGFPVTWSRISWKMGDELSSSLSGLEGLWHLNATAFDASGKGRHGAEYGITYTSLAKLGSSSALFNGVDNYIGIPSIGASVQTVEFWCKLESSGGGVITLAANQLNVAISNQVLFVSGVGAGKAVVYINSRKTSRILPGWNHVAIVLASSVTVASAELGRAGGLYFMGLLDEVALYSRVLVESEIVDHFVSARRNVAGQIRMQCRAGNALPLTSGFVGPDGTADSYYVDPASGILPLSFIGMRNFQYKATLDGDGGATPALGSVAMNTSAGPAQTDQTSDNFTQGSFENSSTIWAGDEMKLPNVYSRGPLNLDPYSSPNVLALWHMDDDLWVAGSATVRDSSGNGRNGSPGGDAALSSPGRAGVSGGYFGGTGYIGAAGGDLRTNDFTVSLWMRSVATGRSALISTYSGVSQPYYALEVNGNGSALQAGSVAFVVSDGSTGIRVASASVPAITDGNWHHVAGMRRGSQIALYVDGERQGVANVGSTLGSLGSAQVTIAKYGLQSIYFSGYLDEIVIHGRALSEAEVESLAALGFDTGALHEYVGPVYDMGTPIYWERIAWQADGPYSKPRVGGTPGLAGLWHADAVTNGWTTDASGSGNDGQMGNGAGLDVAGRFGSCFDLSGAGSPYVSIPNSFSLQSSAVSVELWAHLNNVSGKVLFDKQTGGVGYQLGTDSSGRPYFTVNGVPCQSPYVLVSKQWNHVAATYDGAAVLVYVNGLLVARGAASGSVASGVDARIGTDQGGSSSLEGRVDEVAVHSRALLAGEVSDRYLAGVASLKFQARSWDPDPQGPFVGPDGTTNTYFVNSFESSLLGVVGINRYFQYHAYFSTEEGCYSPVLRGVRVDASGYPTDNPWVAPADGYGQGFLGNLLSFTHVMFTNTDAAVQYQLSGNNGTNWYAWVDGQWSDVTAYTDPVSSWNMSNPKDIITANIGSFYEQLYPKVGGVFKFKAFLKSDAMRQTALDAVSLGYSAGRVVVTVPNGQEIGKDAWLIGVPYTVQWLSAGTVGPRMKLEYSLDSGTTWTTITTNAPNVTGTNNYSFWTTPGTSSDRCRVRVTDRNDATITDLSDSDFQLVERFRVMVPNGGEKWYTGRSNAVVWASAINLGLLQIDYAADGVTYDYSIVFGLPNTPGAVSNQYVWATPMGNPALLSENGKMRIKTLGGQGTDESDAGFTLAGIEITNPQVGSAVKRGGLLNIRWVSAGAGASVGIDFSTDGGSAWTNVIPTAANVPGSNVYAWVATAMPTDTARLRIRSLSDTNVVGISAVFTLADIDVTAPAAGTNWLMSTTNTIRWISGGAGNKVNIYWSIDSGTTWTPVIANYTNASGPNAYNWVVHRFPVATAQVKVESVLDPENLWAASPNFNVAGVRVSIPNGGETWVKDVQNAVQWAYQSVGQNGTIQFSYDGGVSYATIGGPGIGLSDRAYLYTPIKPTVRAKAMIMADNPVPYTNVFDESDAYFTVAGITVTAPTSGVAFTIGTANTIAWTSAGSEDPLSQARLFYTAQGGTNLIATVGNNQAYPGGNTFLWSIQPGVTPSTAARIIVRSGAYTGVSDSFILRGIKFTMPAAGTVFDIGANAPMAWQYAGLDASAVGYFYLSTDGGNTFDPTPLNAALNWSVQAGAYPWAINPDTTPTTNAVLKFRVTASSQPEDIGFEALSQPFTLRGFKVVTPNAGTAWALGQTNQIVWLSALGGTYASLYYAANGVTYDMARPIAANVTLTEGTNRFAWGIESFRLPSTNARVKVVSTIASAESATFRMNGIRVTSPIASDVWAKDETNQIVWTAIGAVGTYTVSLVKDGSTVLPIASGVSTPYYDWAVPNEAVSSNAYIRVQDSGTLIGRSDTFRIVGEPTVGVVSPAPGEFWKVSQTYNIQWSKGGKMENDFRVQYSTEPFIVTNEIFTGVANLDTTNNVYSVPWTVPDRLGQTVIIVQHNTRPTVRDVSLPFYVVGMFTVLSPNGGETSIYALKPTTLSWFTRGTVPEVNLYYSTAPLHGPESWVKINSTPVPNNGGGLGDQLTTYDWTTVDLETATARIRVEQADRPGAYDDSDADFAIQYYQIQWHVFDVTSSNNLDKLSVSDSSGWSESDLTSPVVHRYPYGTFDSVWSRQYFYNNVIFKWSAEPSRTIDVPMKRSDVEPTYNVMANFVYDATNGLFRVTSWLEQQGKVVTTAAKSTVSVFDSSGVSVAQVVVPSPDANGIFWAALPTTLNRGAVYYAKVEIELSGVVYSSGVTFNLRVPTEQEQAQQMMNVLTNIQDTVSRVDTNLNDLAAAQAIFRTGAMAKLDSLTNSAEVIKAGLTNLDLKVDLLSTQALAQLSVLTNTIGVIGPGETNVVAMLKSLASGGASREARILTRPTSVKFGSAVNVLYRSKEGLTVSYQVLNTADTGPMTGAGGIYEATLTANWGLGDYQIVCSDNAGSSDRMIIKVTAMEIDDLALMMGSVSGQLGRVEGSLTNMIGMVSNVNSIVGTLSELTNMAGQVAILTNSLAKITSLTNMSSQLNYVTSVIDRVSAVTNLAPQLGVMTNMLAGLGPLTNFGPQMVYMTNMVGKLTSLTNIGDQVAQMTNAVGRVAAVTNLIPQMAYLTNSVGSLTNMPAKLDSVVAAIGQLGSLTNIGPQVDALSASLDQIIAITNMASQMDSIAGAIGQLGSLTNLGPQVDSLNASIAQIVGLTNLEGRVDALTISMNSITNVGLKVDQLAGTLDAIVASVGEMGSLTNMQPQVDSILAGMGTLGSLTNMQSQVDSILAGMGTLGSLTNLGPQVDALNGAIGEIMALTNMAGQVNDLTSTLNGMTNLNAKVDALTGLISEMMALTNMTAAMGGITNISATYETMTSLQGIVSNVEAMASAMESRIGEDGDPAKPDTVFGMLATIEAAVSASGADNSGAVLKGVNSAKSAAQKAASAASAMKNNVGPGQMDKVLSQLDTIRKSLGAAVEEVKKIPGDMSTESLVKSLREAMAGIEKMAKERGIQPMGKAGEDLQPGSMNDPQAVAKLLNTIAETKAMMQAMQGLMDDAVNKPVVVDWMEGVQ